MVKDDRPWLGVTGRAVFPVSYEDTAVRVEKVWPHSPSASNLKPGDILWSVKGAAPPKISSGPPVIDEIAALEEGSEATLVVQRGGAYLDVVVRLGSLVDASEQGAFLLSNKDVII